jgi:hypothetical protein
MLRWFRTRARVLAAVVLVSVAALGATSVVPHEDDCHGGYCIVSIVPHDASQHSIGRTSPPVDHPLHCVVCHWQRLLRPSIELVHAFAPAVENDVRLAADVLTVPLLFPAAQPPLRSPPASPFHVA